MAKYVGRGPSPAEQAAKRRRKKKAAAAPPPSLPGTQAALPQVPGTGKAFAPVAVRVGNITRAYRNVTGRDAPVNLATAYLSTEFSSSMSVLDWEDYFRTTLGPLKPKDLAQVESPYDPRNLDVGALAAFDPTGQEWSRPAEAFYKGTGRQSYQPFLYSEATGRVVPNPEPPEGYPIYAGSQAARTRGGGSRMSDRDVAARRAMQRPVYVTWSDPERYSEPGTGRSLTTEMATGRTALSLPKLYGYKSLEESLKWSRILTEPRIPGLIDYGAEAARKNDPGYAIRDLQRFLKKRVKVEGLPKLHVNGVYDNATAMHFQWLMFMRNLAPALIYAEMDKDLAGGVGRASDQRVRAGNLARDALAEMFGGKDGITRTTDLRQWVNQQFGIKSDQKGLAALRMFLLVNWVNARPPGQSQIQAIIEYNDRFKDQWTPPNALNAIRAYEQRFEGGITEGWGEVWEAHIQKPLLDPTIGRETSKLLISGPPDAVRAAGKALGVVDRVIIHNVIDAADAVVEVMPEPIREAVRATAKEVANDIGAVVAVPGRAYEAYHRYANWGLAPVTYGIWNAVVQLHNEYVTDNRWGLENAAGGWESDMGLWDGFTEGWKKYAGKYYDTGIVDANGKPILRPYNTADAFMLTFGEEDGHHEQMRYFMQFGIDTGIDWGVGKLAYLTAAKPAMAAYRRQFAKLPWTHEAADIALRLPDQDHVRRFFRMYDSKLEMQLGELLIEEGDTPADIARKTKQAAKLLDSGGRDPHMAGVLQELRFHVISNPNTHKVWQNLFRVHKADALIDVRRDGYDVITGLARAGMLSDDTVRDIGNRVIAAEAMDNIEEGTAAVAKLLVETSKRVENKLKGVKVGEVKVWDEVAGDWKTKDVTAWDEFTRLHAEIKVGNRGQDVLRAYLPGVKLNPDGSVDFKELSSVPLEAVKLGESPEVKALMDQLDEVHRAQELVRDLERQRDDLGTVILENEGKLDQLNQEELRLDLERKLAQEARPKWEWAHDDRIQDLLDNNNAIWGKKTRVGGWRKMDPEEYVEKLREKLRDRLATAQAQYDRVASPTNLRQLERAYDDLNYVEHVTGRTLEATKELSKAYGTRLSRIQRAASDVGFVPKATEPRAQLEELRGFLKRHIDEVEAERRALAGDEVLAQRQELEHKLAELQGRLKRLRIRGSDKVPRLPMATLRKELQGHKGSSDEFDNLLDEAEFLYQTEEDSWEVARNALISSGLEPGRGAKKYRDFEHFLDEWLSVEHPEIYAKYVEKATLSEAGRIVSQMANVKKKLDDLPERIDTPLERSVARDIADRQQVVYINERLGSASDEELEVIHRANALIKDAFRRYDKTHSAKAKKDLVKALTMLQGQMGSLQFTRGYKSLEHALKDDHGVNTVRGRWQRLDDALPDELDEGFVAPAAPAAAKTSEPVTLGKWSRKDADDRYHNGEFVIQKDSQGWYHAGFADEDGQLDMDRPNTSERTLREAKAYLEDPVNQRQLRRDDIERDVREGRAESEPRIYVSVDDDIEWNAPGQPEYGRVRGPGQAGFLVDEDGFAYREGGGGPMGGAANAVQIKGRKLLREKLPPILYHVTTRASRVRADGRLRGQQRDTGLGGTGGDIAISMCTDRKVAQQLLDDVVMEARISHMTAPEALDFLEAEAKRQGFTFKAENYREKMLASFNATESYGTTPHDLSMEFFQQRLSKKHIPDPVLIGRNYDKIDIDDVDIIEIPRENIPEKALVTDFDLRRAKSYSLREVRVHSEIPLVKAETAPTRVRIAPKGYRQKRLNEGAKARAELKPIEERFEALKKRPAGFTATERVQWAARGERLRDDLAYLDELITGTPMVTRSQSAWRFALKEAEKEGLVVYGPNGEILKEQTWLNLKDFLQQRYNETVSQFNQALSEQRRLEKAHDKAIAQLAAARKNEMNNLIPEMQQAITNWQIADFESRVPQPAWMYQLLKWHTMPYDVNVLAAFTGSLSKEALLQLGVKAGPLERATGKAWKGLERFNAHKVFGLASPDGFTRVYKNLVLFKLATMMRIVIADEALRLPLEGINPVRVFRYSALQKERIRMRGDGIMPPEFYNQLETILDKASRSDYVVYTVHDRDYVRLYRHMVQMIRQEPLTAIWWGAVKDSGDYRAGYVAMRAAIDSDEKLQFFLKRTYRTLEAADDATPEEMMKAEVLSERLKTEYLDAVQDFFEFFARHETKRAHLFGDDPIEKLSIKGIPNEELPPVVGRSMSDPPSTNGFVRFGLGQDWAHKALYGVLDAMSNRVRELVFVRKYDLHMQRLRLREDLTEDQIRDLAMRLAIRDVDAVMYSGAMNGLESALRNIILFLPAYRQFAVYWAKAMAKHPIMVGGPVMRAATTVPSEVQLSAETEPKATALAGAAGGFAAGGLLGARTGHPLAAIGGGLAGALLGGVAGANTPGAMATFNDALGLPEDTSLTINPRTMTFFTGGSGAPDEKLWMQFLPGAGPIINMPLTALQNALPEMYPVYKLPFLSFSRPGQPLNSAIDKMFYGVTGLMSAFTGEEGKTLPSVFGKDEDTRQRFIINTMRMAYARWYEDSRTDPLLAQPTVAGVLADVAKIESLNGLFSFVSPLGLRLEDKELAKTLDVEFQYLNLQDKLQDATPEERKLIEKQMQVLLASDPLYAKVVEYFNSDTKTQDEMLKKSPEIISWTTGAYAVDLFDGMPLTNGEFFAQWAAGTKDILSLKDFNRSISQRIEAARNRVEVRALRTKLENRERWFERTWCKKNHVEHGTEEYYQLRAMFEKSEDLFEGKGLGDIWVKKEDMPKEWTTEWSGGAGFQATLGNVIGVDGVKDLINGRPVNRPSIGENAVIFGMFVSRLPYGEEWLRNTRNYTIFQQKAAEEKARQNKALVAASTMRRNRLTTSDWEALGVGENPQVVKAQMRINRAWSFLDAVRDAYDIYPMSTEGKKLRALGIRYQSQVIDATPAMRELMKGGIANRLAGKAVGLTYPAVQKPLLLDSDPLAKQEWAAFTTARTKLEKLWRGGEVDPRAIAKLNQSLTPLMQQNLSEVVRALSWKTLLDAGRVANRMLATTFNEYTDATGWSPESKPGKAAYARIARLASKLRGIKYLGQWTNDEGKTLFAAEWDAWNKEADLVTKLIDWTY